MPYSRSTACDPVTDEQIAEDSGGGHWSETCTRRSADAVLTIASVVVALVHKIRIYSLACLFLCSATKHGLLSS